MNNDTTILIVAKPTRLRDGLRVLLRAIPRVKTIYQAEDGPTALKLITEHAPVLILLDSSLPDDQIEMVVKQVKTGWPQSRCLVLANNCQQQQQARANGADSVLLAGFTGAKFFTTIEALLPGQETPVFSAQADSFEP